MRRIAATVSTIVLVPLGAVGLTSGPALAETTCDGKVPTIVAVAGVETAGTSGDDVILGTFARDDIDGGAGNDTICGLGNADALTGGPGDDRLFGGLDDYYAPDDGYSGDTLVPGPGNDHVDLGDDPASATVDEVDRLADYDTVSYADASGPVTVDLSAGTATGEGTDTIVVPAYSGGIRGSAYDDVLTGTAQPDRIFGEAGDDRIVAGDGDDDLEPGEGADVVSAGDGDDFVISEEQGRDRLSGDGGEDYVEAYGQGSAIGGGDGDDYLVAQLGVSVHGGAGNDEIDAVVGRRTRTEVDGGEGTKDVVRLRAPKSEFPRRAAFVVDVPRRRLSVDGTRRVVYEGVEDLRLSAQGALTYVGGSGRDTLVASSNLRVVARGRGGRDLLVGGRLDDLLDGGAGRDRLICGSGRDRCLAGEVVQQCERRR